MNLQWYPGHMTKTKRLILENIKLVDIVIELLDARIPYSSKNPDIDKLAGNKPRIVVLNKYDLGDEKVIQQWIQWFEEKSFGVVLVNSITGKGINQVVALAKTMLQEKIDRDKKRGRIHRPIRAMVVGIPNVGKSTFINKLVGKSSAKTGDRPGVTKGKQWIKIKKDFELLDTPGILWPKFEDQEVGLRLAFTGAIKDDIIDIQTVALKFIEYLYNNHPTSLVERYNISSIESITAMEVYTQIGRNRGFLQSGGEVDYLRTAKVLLDEFRSGRLGHFTIEQPE